MLGVCLSWYKSSALTRRRDKHTLAQINKLQENEMKSNASFAADPLGESTQFFFDIQKFSFYALNRNCYFPIGNVYAFFVFPLSARTTSIFNFVLRTFVCLFLAFYPFRWWNTRLRFFRLILARFCAFNLFSTVFSIFWWWFFPKWALDVCLSDTSCVYVCAYEGKRKIDLGVYLSWYKRRYFS